MHFVSLAIIATLFLRIANVASLPAEVDLLHPKVGENDAHAHDNPASQYVDSGHAQDLAMDGYRREVKRQLKKAELALCSTLPRAEAVDVAQYHQAEAFKYRDCAWIHKAIRLSRYSQTATDVNINWSARRAYQVHDALAQARGYDIERKRLLQQGLRDQAVEQAHLAAVARKRAKDSTMALYRCLEGLHAHDRAADGYRKEVKKLIGEAELTVNSSSLKGAEAEAEASRVAQYLFTKASKYAHHATIHEAASARIFRYAQLTTECDHGTPGTDIDINQSAKCAYRVNTALARARMHDIKGEKLLKQGSHVEAAQQDVLAGLERKKARQFTSDFHSWTTNDH